MKVRSSETHSYVSSDRFMTVTGHLILYFVGWEFAMSALLCELSLRLGGGVSSAVVSLSSILGNRSWQRAHLVTSGTAPLKPCSRRLLFSEEAAAAG